MMEHFFEQQADHIEEKTFFFFPSTASGTTTTGVSVEKVLRPF
jgi:hypothetical protein